MAVTLLGSTSNYLGTSEDVKPTDAAVNSTFKELDTGDEYYFTGEEWAKVGGASNANG